MDVIEIQRTMEQYVDTGEMVGGILYVHQNGKTIYQNQWGSVDAEKEKPLSYDKTIFRMASLTKIATAVGILKLIEQEKLGLDTELKELLPEFAEMRVVADERFFGVEAYKKYIIMGETAPLEDVHTISAERELTIRDLLTHSSGLEMATYGLLKRTLEAKPEDTLQDRVERFAKTPLDFQPGTATGYSPTAGFDVLARVIEVVSGLPFAKYMKQEIFEPLEMRDAVYQLEGEQKSRLVPLYKPVDGKQVDVSGSEEDLVGMGSVGECYYSGSAGLYCTAQDIDHLTQMLANAGSFDGKQILKSETVKKLYTETAYQYLEPDSGMEWALGVKVRRDPKKAESFATEEAYGWSGAYGTHMVISPKDGLSLTFVMNRADIGGSGSYISRKVEELVFGIWGKKRC